MEDCFCVTQKFTIDMKYLLDFSVHMCIGICYLFGYWEVFEQIFGNWFKYLLLVRSNSDNVIVSLILVQKEILLDIWCENIFGLLVKFSETT